MKFLRPAVLVLMLTSAQTVHANPAEQSLPRSMELVAVMLAQSQICTQGHQHTQLKLNEKIEYASKNTRLPARVVRKEASERAKYISDMITSRGLQNRFCNASMASLD